MSKPPSSCIYCGRLGNRSHEHIIADWVSHVIDQDPNHRQLSSNIIWQEGLPEFNFVIDEERQGAMGQAKLSRVCKGCNEGWMSKLQDSTKPYLEPLIRGHWQQLSAEAGFAIARWTAMTVMNLDAHYQNRGGGVSQEERTILFQSEMQGGLNPPLNWQVWMGMCTGGERIASYHRPFTQVPADRPDLLARGYNSQITTLKLDRVVLQAINFPTQNGPNDSRVINWDFGRHYGVFPIFPIWGGDVLPWREAPIITDKDVFELANFIIRLVAGPAQNPPNS